MNINNIEKKIEEISIDRKRIILEIRSDAEEYSWEFCERLKFNRKFPKLKEMKVACILDEFTFLSLLPECSLKQLTPENWKQELEEFNPDLFMFESSWGGDNERWKMKINLLSEELLDICHYFRKKNKPIVFWNKEDPVHFTDFIDAAKLADFVFTTEVDCINKYRTILKHARVFFMPFAAQTQIFNPIEYYERKSKYCFAGSYYKNFNDRKRDFGTLMKVITHSKELDIYDRNYYKRNAEYRFPRKYKKYIRGYLRASEIHNAYKGYRFNISLNSVKFSSSMCARRIFELLACNTVTISNYSKGVRHLFGDLVICSDSKEQLSDEIQKFDDDKYYSKFRLLGLRKVLSQHTYQDRLLYMIEKIYNNPIERHNITVAIIASANSKIEIDYIIKQFSRQTYDEKKLFIFSNISYDVSDSMDIAIKSKELIENIDEILSNHDYIAMLSTHDYYGANYINDLVLTLKYTNLQGISKSAYYKNNKGHIIRESEGIPYQQMDNAWLRKSLFKSSLFTNEEIIRYLDAIEESCIIIQCLSIDIYNYCMNYTEDVCEIVDDLNISDIGVDLDSVYNSLEE